MHAQVMSANDKMYHPGCFKCVVCQRKIKAGETFALKGKELYCKQDYDLYLASTAAAGGAHAETEEVPSPTKEARVPTAPVAHSVRGRSEG